MDHEDYIINAIAYTDEYIKDSDIGDYRKEQLETLLDYNLATFDISQLQGIIEVLKYFAWLPSICHIGALRYIIKTCEDRIEDIKAYENE